MNDYENPATYMAMTLKPQANGQCATDVTEEHEALLDLARAAEQFVNHEPDRGRKMPGHRVSMYRRVAEWRRVTGRSPGKAAVVLPALPAHHADVMNDVIINAFLWAKQARTDPPGADAEITDALIDAVDRMLQHFST